MNFSFSDVIVFAGFIVALLTYIDRKRSNPLLRLANRGLLLWTSITLEGIPTQEVVLRTDCHPSLFLFLSYHTRF